MIRKDQLLGRGLALFLALGLVLTDLSPAAAIKAYAAEADAVETQMETEEVSEDADPSESGSVDLEARGDGEKTLSKAVLAVDYNGLGAAMAADGYEFSYVTNTTTVPYNGSDYKGGFETALKANLTASVDGEAVDAAPAAIAWKKGTEDATKVDAVGSYTATISLAKKDGSYEAAEDITVSFVVEKAEITVKDEAATDIVVQFDAGTSVSAVVKANKDVKFLWRKRMPPRISRRTA